MRHGGDTSDKRRPITMTHSSYCGGLLYAITYDAMYSAEIGSVLETVEV